MGHHSVAEHAVFNFDILGVSRLAMEEVEKFRLCSYTEKSQRYITLNKDFVMPQEIKGTRFENEFIDIITAQNRAYAQFFDKLKDYTFEKHKALALDPKNHNLLEGWAKEDARYITALATESQVGLTINARNLELMLRRFASHPLTEVQNLGRALYDLVVDVAPSIVIFHQANDRDQKTYPELQKLSIELLRKKNASNSLGINKEVQLVEYTKGGDTVAAASLLYVSSNMPYKQCKAIARKLSKEQLKKIFKTAWKNMQFYDSMLREFEYINLTFNIILSAACFGQLKRHRMSTISAQAYQPALGVTVPQSIEAIGMKKNFQKIIFDTNDVYRAIAKEIPLAAPYVLTNAHRRRLLMQVNARELYHISRLREDSHAQWDIQNIASSMSAQARKVMPLVFELICGKDKYNESYQRIFGHPPKVTEAQLPGVRKIRR
jgi:flavin-dependent thymidylate synthase